MKNLLKALDALIDFRRPLPKNCLSCDNSFTFHPEYGCKECFISFSVRLDKYTEMGYKDMIRFVYCERSNEIAVLDNRKNSKQERKFLYMMDDSYLTKADLEKAEKLCLL